MPLNLTGVEQNIESEFSKAAVFLERMGLFENMKAEEAAGKPMPDFVSKGIAPTTDEMQDTIRKIKTAGESEGATPGAKIVSKALSSTDSDSLLSSPTSGDTAAGALIQSVYETIQNSVMLNTQDLEQDLKGSLLILDVDGVAESSDKLQTKVEAKQEQEDTEGVLSDASPKAIKEDQLPVNQLKATIKDIDTSEALDTTTTITTVAIRLQKEEAVLKSGNVAKDYVDDIEPKAAEDTTPKVAPIEQPSQAKAAVAKTKEQALEAEPVAAIATEAPVVSEDTVEDLPKYNDVLGYHPIDSFTEPPAALELVPESTVPTEAQIYAQVDSILSEEELVGSKPALTATQDWKAPLTNESVTIKPSSDKPLKELLSTNAEVDVKEEPKGTSTLPPTTPAVVQSKEVIEKKVKDTWGDNLTNKEIKDITQSIQNVQLAAKNNTQIAAEDWANIQLTIDSKDRAAAEVELRRSTENLGDISGKNLDVDSAVAAFETPVAAARKMESVANRVEQKADREVSKVSSKDFIKDISKDIDTVQQTEHISRREATKRVVESKQEVLLGSNATETEVAQLASGIERASSDIAEGREINKADSELLSKAGTSEARKEFVSNELQKEFGSSIKEERKERVVLESLRAPPTPIGVMSIQDSMAFLGNITGQKFTTPMDEISQNERGLGITDLAAELEDKGLSTEAAIEAALRQTVANEMNVPLSEITRIANLDESKRSAIDVKTMELFNKGLNSARKDLDETIEEEFGNDNLGKKSGLLETKEATTKAQIDKRLVILEKKMSDIYYKG